MTAGHSGEVRQVERPSTLAGLARLGGAASYAGRLGILMLGLFVFSYGLTMTLGSGLGLGPWDVLHQGLSFHTPLTLGQAGIVVSALVILASLLVRIKPGVATVANMLFVGLFIDGIIASPFWIDVRHASLLERALVDLCGIAIVGLGSALYIKAALGAGPRDSLMLALSRMTGLRVGLVRALIETSALAGGFVLGGTAGIGTVLFALGVGPTVELSFRLIGVPSPNTRRRAPDPRP
jgi:uncharacterized membrane protein YczE